MDWIIKKFHQFIAGTPAGTDIILFADPTTGVIKKVTVDELIKKYNAFTAGTPQLTDIILFADPVTGIPEKVTISGLASILDFVTPQELSSNKFVANFGGQPTGEHSITHNLGTKDFIINVFDNLVGGDLTNEIVIVRTDVNTINLVGNMTDSDPNAYRVVILK